jgi:hypothetical protein
MKKLKVCVLLVFLAIPSFGQGTLVFDQQSSTDENYSPLAGGGAIQFYATVGQSFVPSVSSVGFVRLRFFDITSGNSVGANVVVCLRTNAINGPILATSPVVTMADGFQGSTNFVFSSPVAVTPGTTYYFDVAVQSGDNWGFMSLGDTYAKGMFYGGQGGFFAADLWFREGIVVPEPTALALLGCGLGVWWIGHRGKSSRA